MTEKKYLDSGGLIRLVANIINSFSPKSHTHTMSQISDISNAIDSKISEHNVGTDVHNDIRILVDELDDRLTALADSDDTTLDQLSEIVAYIKDNRELIEQVTTAKVNVDDIVDNLTTNVSNKPLSAAQGVALNSLISSKLDISELLDMVYPIGSIYMSVNSINPAMFIGGTWEQIKDTFLLSCGDTYTAGETGGEAEHTLTVDEMPSHNHKLKTDIDNETWNVTWPEWFEYTDGWTQQAGETEAPATHTTSTGGGTAHNNMPPYLAVYMWKRTA